MSQITVKKVDFSKISVNEDVLKNPRHEWEKTNLQEFAENIWANGLLNPISVVQIDKELLVCAGFRRYGALKLLEDREGFDERFGKISVTVATPDEGEDIKTVAATILVIENLQRENLTPAETASGISQLDDLGLTQVQIAERVGCKQAYVSTMLTIVKKAIPSVWKAFSSGEFTVQDTVGLARLDEEEQQKRMGEYQDVLSNDEDLGELDSAEVAKAGKKSKSKRAPSMAGVRVKFAIGAKKAASILDSIEKHGVNPTKSDEYMQGLLDALRALLGKAEFPFSIVEEEKKPKGKRGRPKSTKNVNAAQELEEDVEDVDLELDDDDEGFVIDDDE
jgi:ParB family transcriptional regulator, chromosome partitioning protein